MRYLNIIICVLSEILLLNFVEGNLTITPDDSEVLSGRAAYFNCSTSIPNSRVRWYFYPVGSTERKIVYDKGTLSDDYVHRFRIENSSEGKFNLVILSVTLGDAGRYVCHDDEGFGDSASADQIVLDGDPVCNTAQTTIGFVGDNSCGLQPDIIQLSCSIKYHGNRHPVVTWRKSGDDNPISVGVNYAKNSSHVDYMLTMIADISLNNNSYFCEIKHSGTKCSNAIIVNILYALGSNNSVVNKTKGDEIKCSANSNVPCNYKWKKIENGNEHVVSNVDILRFDEPEKYRCEAECLFFTTTCTVTVMTVQVYSAEASSGQEKMALLVLPIAVIVVVITVVVWLLLKRRGRMNIRELTTCCTSTAEEPELREPLAHKTESTNTQRESTLVLIAILTEFNKHMEEKQKMETFFTTLCKNWMVQMETSSKMFGEIERKLSQRYSVEPNMEVRKTEELLQLMQNNLEDCKKQKQNEMEKECDWNQKLASSSHRILQLEKIVSKILPGLRADEPDLHHIKTTLDQMKDQVTRCEQMIKNLNETDEPLFKKFDAELRTVKKAKMEVGLQHENYDTDVLSSDKMDYLQQVNEKFSEWNRLYEYRNQRDKSTGQEWDKAYQKIEESSNEIKKSVQVSQTRQKEKFSQLKQEFFSFIKSTSDDEGWEVRLTRCQKVSKLIDELLASKTYYKEEDLKNEGKGKWKGVVGWSTQLTLLKERVDELIELAQSCNEVFVTEDEQQKHTCMKKWNTKCKETEKVFGSLAAYIPDYEKWGMLIEEFVHKTIKSSRTQGTSNEQAQDPREGSSGTFKRYSLRKKSNKS